MNALVDFGVAQLSQNAVPLWLHGLLRNVGYGVAVVDGSGLLKIANPILQTEMKKLGFDCVEGSFMTDIFRDSPTLLRAIEQGRRGSGNLLSLGSQVTGRVSLAIGPLQLTDSEVGLMITTQREVLCGESSLWAYGRALGLTASELKVLHHLTQGLEPKSIAKHTSVSISTVRTHIKAILVKVNVSSLRDLMIEMGRLPPLPTTCHAGRGFA